MSIKGGGGPTPNGKIHLKFLIWLFDYLPKSAINVFSTHLSKTKTKISLVRTKHKIHFMGGKSTKSGGGEGEGEGGLQCWCPWPRFISGVNILLFQAFCAWSLIIPWIFLNGGVSMNSVDRKTWPRLRIKECKVHKWSISAQCQCSWVMSCGLWASWSSQIIPNHPKC